MAQSQATFVPEVHELEKEPCHASHDMASETTRAQEARQRGNDKVRVSFFTHDPTSKSTPAAKTKEVLSLPYCKRPQS